MPSNRIFGIPDGIKDLYLGQFLENLASVVKLVPEMELTQKDVASFLPRDASQYRLGEELHCYSFIYSGTKRTEEVRLRYAQYLAHCIIAFANDHINGECEKAECKLVEVFVDTDSPEDWTICVQFRKGENGLWAENREARRPVRLQ